MPFGLVGSFIVLAWGFFLHCFHGAFTIINLNEVVVSVLKGNGSVEGEAKQSDLLEEDVQVFGRRWSQWVPNVCEQPHMCVKFQSVYIYIYGS